MAKILHTADLHLNAGGEKPYCLSVLDAIVRLAVKEKPAFLLIAGDLFDSFSDLKELRGEFASRIKPLSGLCEIIVIPGNHEHLRRDAALENFELGAVKLALALPFGFYAAGGVEFVCAPHAETYGGYRDWAVPPKDPARARVLLMHGLNSRIYTGPEEETDAGAGVIDDGLFARFGIDYAALGHVHGRREERFGATLAVYPGSPRVWRGSPREAGPRGVYLAEISAGNAMAKFVPLPEAGQLRRREIPLGLDGAPAASDLKRLRDECGPHDLLSVAVSGTVDSDRKAIEAEALLEKEFSPRVRRYETRPRDIEAIENISRAPLAAEFLAELELTKPGPGAEEERKWLYARRFGCEAIAARLKAGGPA